MAQYLGMLIDAIQERVFPTDSRIVTSANEVGKVLFSPLFVCLSACLSVCLVCEQLPDHNFDCGMMKLPGINCCVKIWK